MFLLRDVQGLCWLPRSYCDSMNFETLCEAFCWPTFCGASNIRLPDPRGFQRISSQRVWWLPGLPLWKMMDFVTKRKHHYSYRQPYISNITNDYSYISNWKEKTSCSKTPTRCVLFFGLLSVIGYLTRKTQSSFARLITATKNQYHKVTAGIVKNHCSSRWRATWG